MSLPVFLIPFSVAPVAGFTGVFLIGHAVAIGACAKITEREFKKLFVKEGGK